MVLAGHETTANLLSWTFYLLSKHPDVERRQTRRRWRAGDATRSSRTPALELTRRVLDRIAAALSAGVVFERQSDRAGVRGGFPGPTGRSSHLAVRPPPPSEFSGRTPGDSIRIASSRRAGGSSKYALSTVRRRCTHVHRKPLPMMEAQIILAMIAREQRLELVPRNPVVLDSVGHAPPEARDPAFRRRREGATTATSGVRLHDPTHLGARLPEACYEVVDNAPHVSIASRSRRRSSRGRGASPSLLHRDDVEHLLHLAIRRPSYEPPRRCRIGRIADEKASSLRSRGKTATPTRRPRSRRCGAVPASVAGRRGEREPRRART